MISEDHRVLIEGVRDYARGELLERDREWDRTEASCCELLDQFAEMGLLGLRVPEDDGGVALPMLPYAHIIRELAYASPSVAVTIAVYTMVCEVIKMYAAEHVRDKLLSQLASPGNLSAFAISEPDVGSDPSSVRTRAEKVDGGWRLTGPKMWVTNGVNGRWFAVLARTDRERAAELAALSRHHPSSTEETKDKAQALLDRLQGELTPAAFAAAVERGRARDLEAMVKELLVDLDE